jgi:cytochrome c
MCVRRSRRRAAIATSQVFSLLNKVSLMREPTNRWIAAVVLIATSTETGLAQNIEKGASVFQQCLPCHSIGPGAQNKVGPELNGLDGRHSGSVPGFKYTKDYTDPGLVWNKETFEKYIKNPRAMMPDTTMIFPGIQNGQAINDLWAYISRYNADGSVKKD